MYTHTFINILLEIPHHNPGENHCYFLISIWTDFFPHKIIYVYTYVKYDHIIYTAQWSVFNTGHSGF